MNKIDGILGKIIGGKKPSGKVLGNFNLKKFGGKNDWDFDGVPNKKDCQPRNTMRQDVVFDDRLFILGANRDKETGKTIRVSSYRGDRLLPAAKKLAIGQDVMIPTNTMMAVDTYLKRIL